MGLINCWRCNARIKDTFMFCPRCNAPVTAFPGRVHEPRKARVAPKILLGAALAVGAFLVVFLVSAYVFVEVYGWPPPGLQQKSMAKEAAVECTNDLQSRLYSKRSLELTDDITYEPYYAVGRMSNPIRRAYVVISYAASNAMGVTVDNVAYYEVTYDRGETSIEFIGDYDDYIMYIMDSLPSIQAGVAFEDEEDKDEDTEKGEVQTVSAKKVAKEVGCDVYEG